MKSYFFSNIKSMTDLSLFYRTSIDQRVSALSAQASKLGPRLFSRNNSKIKKKSSLNFPPNEDTYKIFEGRSDNGSVSRKYFYINGQRCDAFGRTINDVGYTPIIGIEHHRPISYAPNNQNISENLGHSKKKYHPWDPLDQGQLLQIKREKLISESDADVNIRAIKLLKSVNDKMEESRVKGKSIHNKIFNPQNRSISRQIVNDDILWHYMNYPIEISDFTELKTSYKSLNLKDDIKSKFMSTN